MVIESFDVFADEVYTSTDLNRRAGEVLDHARSRPITISRNKEQFALLKREQAARLYRLVSQMYRASQLLSEIRVAMSGETPSEEFSWLSVYEKDDLEKLLDVVLTAMRHALMRKTDGEEIDALIYQWTESALVAQSGVLDHAMYNESADEQPLTSPNEALQSLEDDARLTER